MYSSQGFAEIQNLTPFTKVQKLFLEGNQLKKITNLEAQTLVKELHLQDNKLGEKRRVSLQYSNS